MHIRPSVGLGTQCGVLSQQGLAGERRCGVGLGRAACLAVPCIRIMIRCSIVPLKDPEQKATTPGCRRRQHPRADNTSTGGSSSLRRRCPYQSSRPPRRATCSMCGRSGECRSGQLVELVPACWHAGTNTAAQREDSPGLSAGTAEKVASYLASLDDGALGWQDSERVQAAIVLASAGKWDRFLSPLRLLRLDWRDVLVAGGLADADWPTRLEAELPGTRPDG